MRIWGALPLAAALAACSATAVPPSEGPAPTPSAGDTAQPKSAKPESAMAAGVTRGPSLAGPDIDTDMAKRALAAFRTSCPALVKRTDASGLTTGADWRDVCESAKTTHDDGAREFFIANFAAVRIGDGRAFATGYFEPEIAASRKQGGEYQTPIYSRPNDLIDVDLGQFSDSLAGKRVRGRIDGTDLIPYYDRTAIEQGALSGRGLELAWAADPVEVFFLQVQGSGRLRLRDGSVMRIGYAGQNGRAYTGIGKLMLDRGLIGKDQASMQGIVDWLHAHPAEGREVMRENKSFVFFHRLDGPGPIGALGLSVAARASVAADPAFVPLGAPVFLSMDRSEASGLWVAQDTGGAIKGSNRFDTFWGAGDDARRIAGGMAAHGTAFILLPKDAAKRVIADGTP
ncbi:murein transglycosylase A [Stakelama sp. CBK3Z-3]|uniref:peptidoglycan lytic exotransglycosylase n=1 Tax=Stakelama flava TaxID=2860338 RepID=A0ABS6XS71_9SPHN|nr:murein transglycosylase A [Stakelama flava]